MKKKIKIHSPFDKPSPPGNEGLVGVAKQLRTISMNKKQLVQLEIEYPLLSSDNVESREPERARSASASVAIIASEVRAPSTPVGREIGCIRMYQQPKNALMSLIY